MCFQIRVLSVFSSLLHYFKPSYGEPSLMDLLVYFHLPGSKITFLLMKTLSMTIF